MKEMFISVTGFNHYFGLTPFKPGQILYCKKDPDNAYDDEAITVLMQGMGKVGYVANSVHTTARGTMSAGRIYDRVESVFAIECLFVTSSCVICKVIKDGKDPNDSISIEFREKDVKL